MTRKLSKILVDDDRLNRWQDQVIGVLNPVLQQLGQVPTVTGSKGGNAALASLISALVKIGLIEDKTT